MAKLSELGIKAAQQAEIRFVGEPSEAGFENRDGIAYFSWKLAEPIAVRCSTVPAMEAVEVEELYMLETTLQSEDWTKDEKGAFIPDFRADISKGLSDQNEMIVALYQSETIRKWRNGLRQSTEQRNTGFLVRMRERGLIK